MTEKTHYRKVFKSDHLGSADLEDFKENGSNLIFTIAYVNQEKGAKVAGKKIDANIAYFTDKIKPLVLNATNSKIMSKLAGSCFVEEWQNITVQLYIDPNVKYKGDTVSGVRISPNQVRVSRGEVTPGNKKLWNGAISAFNRDGNFKAVLERADISDANQKLIIEQCNAAANNTSAENV